MVIQLKFIIIKISMKLKFRSCLQYSTRHRLKIFMEGSIEICDRKQIVFLKIDLG